MTPLFQPPRKLTLLETLSRAGWWERCFLASLSFLLLAAVLRLPDPIIALTLVIMIAAAPVAIWRLGRRLVSHLVWRLRNRLIVAYIFIALVPVVLLVTLGAVISYFVTGQLAIYLVNSELERQVGTLRGAAQSVLRVPPERRQASLDRLGAFFEERLPNFEIRLDQKEVNLSGAVSPRAHSDFEIRIDYKETYLYPADASLPPAPPSLADGGGILLKGGEYFVWAKFRSAGAQVIAMAPLSNDFLSQLMPSLGPVSLGTRTEAESRGVRFRKRKAPAKEVTPAAIPAPLNRADIQLTGFRMIPITVWEEPDHTRDDILLVETRFLAVLKLLFSSKQDWDQSIILLLLIAIGVLFLIFEITALLIGVTLTRTITATVHDIYEGTNRVMEGNFSHRIPIKGQDQLAQLGASFNRMTENLEQLLKVAKDNERLNAELEIAREVQRQLYPKSVPASASLALTAHYQPARMVSGDYFDFHRLSPTQLCLSMGDVAGKGISAALLMATVQSSFRSHIQSLSGQMHVSHLVTELNKLLYNNTAPEKFSTFFLGIYDEASSTLRYTNAGHLPPILIRGGEASLLAVDGMVVGAFPFAQYGESSILLEPHDLLLLYTDGITEPQNEFGEMFGEDRLIEVVKRNARLNDEAIIHAVMEAVNQWTGSPELQDDMTLLIARRH
ncbi:MAG: PP2C family protein-serine/threonine phosphatase [Acidobacteriota bacterium]